MAAPKTLDRYQVRVTVGMAVFIFLWGVYVTRTATKQEVEALASIKANTKEIAQVKTNFGEGLAQLKAASRWTENDLRIRVEDCKRDNNDLKVEVAEVKKDTAYILQTVNRIEEAVKKP